MTASSARRRTRSPRVLAAYQIMQHVYDQCRLSGASLEKTHLAIRGAYPWGERRRWPYKAWLIARREFYEAHGLPLKARRTIRESVQEREA